jgi:hypothetical protein
MIGKRVLVGLTILSSDDESIEQRQITGVVATADADRGIELAESGNRWLESSSRRPTMWSRLTYGKPKREHGSPSRPFRALSERPRVRVVNTRRRCHGHRRDCQVTPIF